MAYIYIKGSILIIYMPLYLQTIEKHIDNLANAENKKIIKEYQKYMINKNKADRTIRNNLNYLTVFCKWIEANQKVKDILISKINDHGIIEDFLSSRRKSKSEDPEEKWVTTYNDYLIKTRTFYRWLYNVYYQKTILRKSQWDTPNFVRLDMAKTTFERLSPYDDSEIWTKEELFSVLKYEPSLRNKAMITLMWDTNARPSEITALKVRDIDFHNAVKYAKGFIPANTKTGKREITLIYSFVYCLQWKEKHLYKNNGKAPFFYDEETGKPLKPDTISNIFRKWKARIQRALDNGAISDPKERENSETLLNAKKWNPYCLRHSSISENADTLPEALVIKLAGWGQNTRQKVRYIKKKISAQGEALILKRVGLEPKEKQKVIPSSIVCPNQDCKTENSFDAEICRKCNSVLSYSALNKIEEKRKQELDNLVDQRLRDITNKYALSNFKREIDSIVWNSKALASTGRGEIKRIEWLKEEQLSWFLNRMKKNGEEVTEDQINYIKDYLEKSEPIELYRAIPSREQRKAADKEFTQKVQQRYNSLSPEELEENYKEWKVDDEGKSGEQIRDEERKSLKLHTKIENKWEKEEVIEDVEEEAAKEMRERKQKKYKNK